MVPYKQIYHPDHDCIHHFILRGAQDANLVFHQRGIDAIILHDNTTASALEKVVTCAGEVLFERKTSTSTKPEATLQGLPPKKDPLGPWRTKKFHLLGPSTIFIITFSQEKRQGPIK